jgi:hypothetical protein
MGREIIVPSCGDLQWHDVHTEFQENLSFISMILMFIHGAGER